MRHPLCINGLEEDDTLELTDYLAAVFLFLSLIYLAALFVEGVDYLLLGNALELVLSECEVLVADEPAEEVFLQTNDVPVVVVIIVDEVVVNSSCDEVLHHLEDILVEVLTVENL